MFGSLRRITSVLSLSRIVAQNIPLPGFASFPCSRSARVADFSRFASSNSAIWAIPACVILGTKQSAQSIDVFWPGLLAASTVFIVATVLLLLRTNLKAPTAAFLGGFSAPGSRWPWS